MTDTNSAEMTDDPAASRVDVQDPLPETNWLWRRVYTFVLSLISVYFIYDGIEKLHQLGQPAFIYSMTRYMVGVLVLLITYYMIAPSAEQLTKLIQSSKILQSGVTINRTATAQTPEGGSTSAQTTAGIPAAPEAPETAPEEDVAPRSKA